MAQDDLDDDELHAELRTLVEQDTTSDSDAALREVLRRGRRKRTQRRLGAIAGVVVAITGIGTATTLLHTIGSETPQLQVATREHTTEPHPSTDARSESRNPSPHTTRTPSSHTTRTPRSAPPSRRKSTEPPNSMRPVPQLANGCPNSPLRQHIGPAYQVPEGLTICLDEDRRPISLLHVVRDALSETAVSVHPNETQSGVRVIGEHFVSTISIAQRRYVGSLTRVTDQKSPTEPLIVRPTPTNTRSNITQTISVPVAIIYYPDGRVYLLRLHPPDPMPAELLDRIVQELATSRG